MFANGLTDQCATGKLIRPKLHRCRCTRWGRFKTRCDFNVL